jgi:hypothetical protein
MVGRRSSPRLILEIDIRKLLSVAVAHDKASVQFFDGSRRREAAGGHRQPRDIHRNPPRLVAGEELHR